MKITQTKPMLAAKNRKIPSKFSSPNADTPSPRHPFVRNHNLQRGNVSRFHGLTEGSLRLYFNLMFSITPDSCILFILKKLKIFKYFCGFSKIIQIVQQWSIGGVFLPGYNNFSIVKKLSHLS